jgi:stage IV sporulation protein FB
MTWLEGFEPFFVMILSAFLHEAGHILMMRTLGYRVRRVDILPMGALIVCPEGIPDSDEVKIALAGPLVSLFLALLSSLWFLKSQSALSLLATLINLVFGAFNLLPVRKLDGGKALFCFLSGKTKRAEKICSLASKISIFVFFLFGLSLVILSDFNLGVMILTSALLVQFV